MKDAPQPQSRLSQWTHPNSMENLSGNPSPLEPNLNKHGAIPTGASLALAGKPPMDDSYSPYNLMPSSESPASPLAPPDSWGPGKGASEKISNGTNISWPPGTQPLGSTASEGRSGGGGSKAVELSIFYPVCDLCRVLSRGALEGAAEHRPGDGPQHDPGSVPSGPTINTNIQDVNRYLLRDRSGGKLSDMKSTWSPGPISHTQASLSHELWKVPQGPRGTPRPPPALPGPDQRQAVLHLGAPWGWRPAGRARTPRVRTTWSTDSSSRTSSWLVLRNLTPQIDGSTLRTLCMQHGPLITFHLNLTQGNAVVRYSSKEEAAKAQKSLHMCVLGNTTILAEFAGEEEVNRFFAQGQSLTPTTSWQPNPGTNQTRLGVRGRRRGGTPWATGTAAGWAEPRPAATCCGAGPAVLRPVGAPSGRTPGSSGAPPQSTRCFPGTC
ncbi:hypothetical protein ANANG_G00030270 [Anguilla anguilla]|uniref:RRM domain-containing protein n=1 Tax=Anguilla anguilla TaxID=7936 RepID=A0A9D3S3U2_ANGAN|nr:hypothetical protein ANANG_G00030270 [Anguilla anguilla]